MIAHKHELTNVYILKLISGEEIITMLIPSELISQGKPDPMVEFENPLLFVRNSKDGSIRSYPWCQWSANRIFMISSTHIMIAEPAYKSMAQHYFNEMYPEATPSANDSGLIKQLTPNAGRIVTKQNNPAVKPSAIIVPFKKEK